MVPDPYGDLYGNASAAPVPRIPGRLHLPCVDELTITTDGPDGREVTEYLGAVSGEAVMGANVVGDIAAGIRDVVGGRSGSYGTTIETGREEALADLRAEARELDADDGVGTPFDYEEVAGGTLWINLSETAVGTRSE